ncbi:MAG TPA: DUF2283 domain-containing protein [Pirellulaceae bacterium]|nr:DUF2283 domain-containing protein [Pirellulaceae bacterium]
MELNFGIAVTVDNNNGQPISVYFQIRRGRVHETREFADGAAFADYDKHGSLLGIELLSPCRVSIVDQLAANEPASLRTQAKRFMRESGPRSMIAA